MRRCLGRMLRALWVVSLAFGPRSGTMHSRPRQARRLRCAEVHGTVTLLSSAPSGAVSKRHEMCSHCNDYMERMAKILFRNHPRLVRYRKLRELCFALVFSVTASVGVGVMMFLINRLGVPQ